MFCLSTVSKIWQTVMEVTKTISIMFVILIISIFITSHVVLGTHGNQYKKSQCQQIVMDEALDIFDGKETITFYINESRCWEQNTTISGNILIYISCGPSYYSFGDTFPTIQHRVTHLLFTNYKVHRLFKEVLWNLTELIYLDLSANQIFSLSRFAFFKQVELKVLNLAYNYLNTWEPELAYPHGVFETLAHKLELLNLNQINRYNSSGMPIAEVGVLKNLEGLVLDIVTGGNETIAPTFGNLKKLRRLQLKLQNEEDFEFKSDFFKNLKGIELKCLYITSINGLIEGVYKILPGMDYLTLLDLQYSHLLFAREDSAEFWNSIGKTNIKTVDLTNTGLDTFSTIDGLDKLTAIFAGNNYLDSVFIQDVLPNLRQIVLKSNQMSRLTFYSTLWYFMKYRMLEHIEINYQASSPFTVGGPGATDLQPIPIQCTESAQNIEKQRYSIVAHLLSSEVQYDII